MQTSKLEFLREVDVWVGDFLDLLESCEVEFCRDVLTGWGDDFDLRGLGFALIGVEFQRDDGATERGGGVGGG